MYQIVDNTWISKTRDFATRVCNAYQMGKKEHSKSLALDGKPEIHNDTRVQFVGRIGEIAACLAFKLDPNIALNWSDTCDNGSDFVYLGQTYDVKSTDHPKAKRLIWPKSKTHFMIKAADVFIMAKVRLDTFEADVDLVGYTTKHKFFKACKYASGEPGIVDGTPYMLDNELSPLEDIINVEA